MSLEPVSVEVAPGRWAAVNTVVAASSDGGAWVARHPLSPRFARRASAEAALTVSNDDAVAELSLIGATGSSAVREGSELRYDRVLPGTDLVYEVTAGSVKESLVIASEGAARSSYRWRLSGSGYTPSPAADGSIELLDASGEVALLIPPAVLVDSAGVAGVREPATTNASMSVTPSGSDWIVTVTPDPAWMSDPARVYPVYLDPTVSQPGVGPDNVYAMKSDGTVLYNSGIRIGNSRDNGDKHWRTYLHYNYEQFFGLQVVGAAMHFVVESGTLNGYNAQVYWPTGETADYNGPFSLLQLLTVESSGLFDGPNIAGKFAALVDQRVSDVYFMVNGQESAGLYTYKSMRSALYVTTTTFPAVTGIASPAPAQNATGVTLTPTLKVSSTDASSWRYIVSLPGQSPVVDTGFTTATQFTVPADKLMEGTAYDWRIEVRSSTQGL
jgi:hypothetical protein